MSSGLETQTNNEHKLLSSKPYTTCLETNPIKTKISFREYDEREKTISIKFTS